MSPLLNWISDDKLFNAINKLNNSITDGIAKSNTEFDDNVTDPFSALTSMMFFNLSQGKWKDYEKYRRKQKSLSNAIGLFHQHILGSITGWKDLGTNKGIDIVNRDKQIIAEIKNKHNTVKGSDLVHLYNKLKNTIESQDSAYNGYTAYYVTIIPESPNENPHPFTPSDSNTHQRVPENPNIIQIDGKQFYSLATGEDSALVDLFDILYKIFSYNKYNYHLHLKPENKPYICTIFRCAFGIDHRF